MDKNREELEDLYENEAMRNMSALAEMKVEYNMEIKLAQTEEEK